MRPSRVVALIATSLTLAACGSSGSASVPDPVSTASTTGDVAAPEPVASMPELADDGKMGEEPVYSQEAEFWFEAVEAQPGDEIVMRGDCDPSLDVQSLDIEMSSPDGNIALGTIAATTDGYEGVIAIPDDAPAGQALVMLICPAPPDPGMLRAQPQRDLFLLGPDATKRFDPIAPERQILELGDGDEVFERGASVQLTDDIVVGGVYSILVRCGTGPSGLYPNPDEEIVVYFQREGDLVEVGSTTVGPMPTSVDEWFYGAAQVDFTIPNWAGPGQQNFWLQCPPGTASPYPRSMWIYEADPNDEATP